jgi:hypothetical protein
MSEAKESFSIKLQLLIFQNPYPIGVRVAKRIEKTDTGFLDTNLISFGSTRKPFGSRSSSSEAYREHRFNISIIHYAFFD